MLGERTPLRFPGATGAFALFGEVLLVGLLVAAGGILLVTLPAALAAGIRHLRRYLNAEASHQRQFWRDYLSALPGGLAVGAGAAGVAVILVADILLANLAALPGGIIVAAAGWIGLIAAGVAVLLGAASWSPASGWKHATRGIPNALRADPVGNLYLASAVLFVGIATWMLVPLILPALGLAVFSIVAIPGRRRRRSRFSRIVAKKSPGAAVAHSTSHTQTALLDEDPRDRP